jgi:hypothetical protein
MYVGVFRHNIVNGMLLRLSLSGFGSSVNLGNISSVEVRVVVLVVVLWEPY